LAILWLRGLIGGLGILILFIIVTILIFINLNLVRLSVIYLFASSLILIKPYLNLN
jgi:hypothetical protein